jgi:cyclophilin family peptidyl-prolyl cis-trans isomerase
MVQRERIMSKRMRTSWEGEAPAEPNVALLSGSAGASPSRSRRILKTIAFHRAILLAGVCAAGLTGCGDSESSSAPADQPTRNTNASNANATAKQVDLKHPVVRIETSHGAITVELDAVRAPGTVRNFLNYDSEGFYDNTIVHYVDPEKMILAGGYTLDRQAKPARAPIRNEAHNGLKNVRGTIAMTRDPSQIDNATSQFFINLADAPQRDHRGDSPDEYGYCVFGEVTDGLDIAERISQSPTTDLRGDLVKTPDPPVVIKSIRVVR